MRRSLLASSVAIAGFTGSSLAASWTITGATAGGAPQSISSLQGGSIALGLNTSIYGSGNNGNPVGVRDALFNELGFVAVVPGNLSFFGFTDTGGNLSTFFGFVWFADENVPFETLTVTSSNSNNLRGVITNMGLGETGGSFTPATPWGAPPEENFFYYLFAGVTDPSTISISGTVPNQYVQWLTYSSGWTSLPDRTGASTGGSTGPFGLGSAQLNAAPIPGAGATAMLGGVAAALLGRRRSRRGH